MKINEILVENNLGDEYIAEMPLPADWDTTHFRPGSTFKARLAYALERAKKIGTGSSRIAMIIEYEGRQTVLKIAKNAKGLVQNNAEASILDDGYTRQLGIAIPIIDYDTENREPLWLHTELATKANDKTIANMMGADSLNDVVQLASTIFGKSRFYSFDSLIANMQKHGKTEDQIQTATDYANTLADMANSFDVELGDLNRAANWGIYQGKPVIIDIGGTSSIITQYYK